MLTPDLGHGVGLRRQHFAEILADPPPLGWFEVISENFMVPGGNPRRVLAKIRERYPVVLHGVSLSIGSSDPLDERYLDELAALAHDIEPAYVSDHLCWTGVRGQNGHDLFPVPYTEEALAHVVARVERVQERLGSRILLENPSSYLTFRHSTLSEAEFLAEVARRADCGILLDVNNVYVSAHNHGFDALEYLETIPVERVGQFHLAGHSHREKLLLDTHDHEVPDGVWDLYRAAVARFGRVPTLIEWDDKIPPLARLLEESATAARIEGETLAAGIRRAHA
jgi:uncharacterized protein (UPF0276 family)